MHIRRFPEEDITPSIRPQNALEEYLAQNFRRDFPNRSQGAFGNVVGSYEYVEPGLQNSQAISP